MEGGVTIPENSPDRPEYERLFHDLVMGRAEETLAEHAELVEHGFTVVQVVGSPALIYRRGDRYYTRDYALATIHAIKEDRRE